MNVKPSVHKYQYNILILYRFQDSTCFYLFIHMIILPPNTPGWRLWTLLWWREGADPCWCLRGGEGLRSGLGLTTMVPESGLDPETDGRRPWLWREESSQERDLILVWRWLGSLPGLTPDSETRRINYRNL